MFSLSACIAGIPTKIESIDFDNVKNLLKEQYELNLPDSATYIGGYFDNAFRDPSIIAYFMVTTRANIFNNFSNKLLRCTISITLLCKIYECYKR